MIFSMDGFAFVQLVAVSEARRVTIRQRDRLRGEHHLGGAGRAAQVPDTDTRAAGKIYCSRAFALLGTKWRGAGGGG